MPTPIERAALEWLRRRDEWERLHKAHLEAGGGKSEKVRAAALDKQHAERALIALLRDVEEG